MISVFDSWEPMLKARKAKGLGRWKKLESIAGFLQGKKAEHITFTCSHPAHGGEPVKHVLGSTTGNLHFLMGYGNPGFSLAPYHWLIIDPNLDEKEVKSLAHPSRPEFWKTSGLELTPEGDSEEGKPHPQSKKVLESSERKDKLQNEAVRASNGYREYLGVPSLGLVFGLNNSQAYRWDLIKDSFFSVTNPEFKDAMNAAEDELETTAKGSYLGEFAEDVYPVVSQRFPKPGSVIPLQTRNGVINGVVTKKSIDFYDIDGAPTQVLLFDTVKKSIDLCVDGTTHPDIIANFAINILGLETQEIVDSSIVKGYPSDGYEDVSPSQPKGEANRDVVNENGYFKVVTS